MRWRAHGLAALAAVGVLLVTPVAASAQAAAAADPISESQREWLDEHGPLRIGWPQFPPLAMAGPDGDAQGYGVDVWELASLKAGVEVEHVIIGSLAAAVAALRDGSIDVLGGSGPREDLADGISHSEPFAWAPTGVAVLLDRVSGLTTDLTGATVTTVPGSPLEARMAERFPAASYVPYPDTLAALSAVDAGDVDAFYGPYAMIGFMAINNDLQLVPYGEAGSDIVPISSSAPIDGPAAAIVDTLRSQLTDAELSLTHVRWTGIDLSDPDDVPAPRWLLPFVLAVLVVVVLAFAFVVVLRGRVRTATLELRELNAELEGRVGRRTTELHDAAVQLRRSNAALKRFASTAAHDLKSPVTAIAGLATLLHRFDLPKEERDDLAERVGQSAMRLGGMVDAMLEDAVAAGAHSGGVTGDAFAQWVREVTDPEVHIVGGAIEIDVQGGHRLLEADVEVLRRCAVNLVSNAAKYAVNETGMKITVRLHRVGGTYELSVEDNGPGIPQPLWAQVFDHGSRLVHDSRGFGLGLSAIRDLVQGAGGSIRLGDSETLGGAAFTAVLPVVPLAEAADDALAALLGTDAEVS